MSPTKLPTPPRLTNESTSTFIKIKKRKMSDEATNDSDRLRNTEKFRKNLSKSNDNNENLNSNENLNDQPFMTECKCCPVYLRNNCGNINQVLLQQCSSENRQRIQNIQLLRVINTPEDPITVPKYKDTFITAEQSGYLRQTYQLADQSSLSMRYTSTAENLVKKFINSEKKEYDNKQHLKDIISKKIAEHKSLAQVKSDVEKEFHKPLSTIDKAYIERKYIKYCTTLWLQETTKLLREQSKSRAVIQEIFNSLDDIKGLSQIPNSLNRLEYYTLLMKHYKLVRKEDEKTSISRFKKECLEQIVAYSDSAKKGLVFLETFINFLGSSKNLQSIIAELELENFCRGVLSFDKLINNIDMKLKVDTYSENLTVLQKATEGLKEEEDLFLIDKFKEVLGAYIKPVEIQERKIDDRLVVEVIGKNVVVSVILQQLENKLSENPNIEEVRFVGADIIHIDENFKSETWHGKNIIILAKAIKIYGEIIWNVSGKDNNHIYSSNAGTEKDGHGKQGKDGYAGESGGNVLILTEKIENPEDFTVISNGGKGSKGQDGGNGRDGDDGIGITKEEFDEKFPPVATFFELTRAEEILKTVNNIKENLSAIETEWYENRENMIFNEKVIGKIIKDGKQCQGIFSINSIFSGNIFINAVTNRGNEITFSFERGGIKTNCQAFLIYKGSLGQPGGHGGEYGLGGEGGYAGDITVKNLENSQKFNTIKGIKQEGEEGERGKGGLYGNHGKNGWDIGYMDFSVSLSIFFGVKWKLLGTDLSSKLSLEYTNDWYERVRCPYREREGKSEIFVKVKASTIEHEKQEKYKERKNTRQNNDRQHHAQAARKKNISQDSILANYSHHLSSIEKNTLQNLTSDLEKTKQQALQAITENQEQQEKQTTELRTRRHSTYQNINKHYNDIFTTTPRPIRETIDVKNSIDELVEKEPLLLLGNRFQLKNIELSLSQLNQLFSILETLEGSPSEMSSSQKKLLTDKYRLATLQEIAKQLPLYQEVTDNTELTPKNASRYLIEAKENDSNISHATLGTLNQYFYDNSKEQREKISKFGKEKLQNTENNEALKHSIRAFILEVGKLEEAHTDVKKYYNKYKEFLEKQEHSLNIFFEAFMSELSRPRHTEVFDLWVESIKDKSLSSKLEKKIQKDDFLKVLYNRFNSQLKQEYNWKECCKDQAILKEYNDYIQEKGPLLGSCRELLAYIFDINIRLYAENQNNKLFLQDNHNPSSKQIIHILCRDNKFIQLNIDKNYLKLEEGRKKKDDLYAKILLEIESFEQKQKFDDYLSNWSNNRFLPNNSTLKNEQLDQSFNEKEDIEKIIEYFPDGEEKQQLKARLEKITSQYIGQQEILHNVLKRFATEGKHVSYQELCCLINSILTSSIEDRKERNTFCWIIAAHSQRNWIDELTLLQLENYFKKPLTEKSKWREYLSKIENKDILLLFNAKLDQCKPGSSISTQCINDILYLLSNIPNEIVSLEGLELSEWPYALKENYWTCRLSKLVDWQKSDLSASYYLLSTENTFGTDLVKKFLEALEEKKQELSPDALTKILSNFHNEKWSLSEEELNTLNRCTIDEWEEKMQQKFTANKEERKITQLVELIKGNANTSKEISNNLPSIKRYIESIDKYVIAEKLVGNFTEHDIKNWVKEFPNNIGEGKQDIEKEMLAVIDRAIELKRKFKLRDTQKLTVLALLTNDRSTLAQVSTGEGKSLIVVAASIMKALYGKKVDIITSSSVLAKRDAEGNRDVYNLFGINVSHNSSENIEKRKEAYSGNQVVYGDLSNFQRDYLLDKFYGKNILGDRNFENVIVDEVDSMLLDKGNNMLYLSHDLAGLDKLESVYIYIWQWINRPVGDHKELSYAFDTKAIKEAVLNDLYGLIKKEDIGKLSSELSEQQRNIMWERLIKTEILDDKGKLLKGNISDNELNKVLSPEFNCYKDRFHYLLKECIEREKFIHVPNNLRPFIEQHLESWINSAITAFFMKTEEDYVVDVDRTGTSPDRNPNIRILDRDTGTDQANSQWDEALHQFLQLKHGCKLSLQSLKAVFISNVSFFKLYSNLYGLTGTLGSQRERDLLQEIHGVDFVTVPTARSKQFNEDEPILCTGKEEWINRIRDEAKKLTEERSVLIICETVNDAETLYKAFGGKDARHVHTYTRDYEEFDIAKDSKELEQGQIIIATNLAGRGTDIKIKEELRKAKGLHVCLTYLPNNLRIEQQAFGRAARSGDEGSGQLIIMDSKGQGYSNSKVLDLKKKRDTEELHRISDIKAYYETQITMEESCFKKFKKQYEQLKKDLDDKKVPTEVKEILLQSCSDKWAFWLDEHNKYVRDLTDEQDKRNLHNLLDKFISRLKNLDTGYSEKWLPSYDELLTLIIEHDSTSWLAWVKENPVQMIKLGKYLSQNERHKNAHKNAIELFDEVIKKEPYFSEAARYYKAFALVKKVDLKQKPLKEEDKKVLKEFKQELRKAARLLDEHSKLAINAAGIIGKIKKNNNESIIQINAYEEQQKSLANLYYMFSRSIDDIFGHSITPQSFVNSYIKEGLAKVLYEDLLREGVLKKPSVKKNISEEELKTISSDYGISAKILQDFLSKHEEINEKDFRKKIKEEVQLPSRNEFWKLLIEQKVLSEEVKYITIDNEKLGDVDLSLLNFLTEKVDKKELNKQTLESNNEQSNNEIFLNAEWVTQQKNNGNIFKKDDFIKIVGRDKYKVLKERGVLSFNRKAHIDKSKNESVSFSQYDSITLEDFTKVNITKSEAEKILAELVKQNVVEKKDKSENSAYGLKIKFDEMKQVQLSFCPVYENVVRGLLSVCFTYRVALQKIARQLEEENFPIRMQLMTKPHQILVSELLEQKVIRPVTVTTKDVDLEDKLKSMYSQTMTKDNFKLMLSQDKLIPGECTEKLFNCLVEKKWIIKYNPIQSIQDEGIGKENIKNASKSLVQDLYCINSPDKRQKPLSFSPEASHKNKLIELQSVDKTVEKVLDNQLQLAKEDTIKNIVSTLKRSRSSLKALKVPDGKLKPLTELCSQGKFANIEEVHVFSLNGLDQLLQLEEKKWTREMLLNTAVVTAMGVTQIAIGTAIELYSVGMMTHVGAAFVNEGVNDLFFAAGALKSGYFSWEDYRQHKLESLMITAATVGIGAYLSRGAKVSRFGHKLAGPNFEFGKKVAEMSGTQLIETAGWKVVRKEVTKCITLKAMEGVAFGLVDAGVDTLVENYLQGLCEGIASDILSDIEREVERHSISASLEKTYKTLGEMNARNEVNDLTNSVFTERNCLEQFLSIANKIVSSVTQGIAKAVEKSSATSNKLVFPIHTIGKVVIWSELFAHITNMKTVTSNFLDNLDKKINSKLEEHTKRNSLDQKQKAEKDTSEQTNIPRNQVVKSGASQSQDYESFKKEVINQWKSLLREKAGQVIAQHIVSPILKKSANHLIRYVGKKVQKVYKSYKESECLEHFRKLKQEYEEELQSEQHRGNRSTTENHITEKYHKDLRKLMIKTRNPNLLADIVRENIPMDMTCVSVCTQVVYSVLKEQGVVIPGLTIIVEGDGGIRQEFSSGSDEVGKIIIPLELKDNHFEFCGSSTSENNRSSESKNNCLYEALSEAIPGLRDIIAPEEFRANVANCIEHDKGIRYHIQQGWHRLPISLGAFGGAAARKRSKVAHDCESSSFDDEGLFSKTTAKGTGLKKLAGKGDPIELDSSLEQAKLFLYYKKYRRRVRNVSKHLVARFTRFFRFGGMIQRASEQTNIPRNQVVKSGASQFQDQSSKRGKDIHAAHVVRAGEIDSKIVRQFNQLYDEFANFLGHTQNVPKYANEWHGVGGKIDKFQSTNLKKLAGINFGGNLTAEDANTIQSVKEDFIKELDNRINGGKLGNIEKSELKYVKTALTDIKIEDVFEKGKEGYSGKGMDAYR